MSKESVDEQRPGISSKTVEDIDEEKENEAIRLIEAILFVSGRFLDMSDLVTYSDLNPIMIREVIDNLSKKHEKDDSAFRIVAKGKDQGREMWKMDVKPEYTYLVNRLATGSSEFTKAEQETLAIIAFKQPIKQSVLVKIRGNKSYDDIKKFVELGLVRKKKSGHTYELNLSDEFYDYFNVSEGNIKDRKNSEEEDGA
ncbi:MAG: SMC-Scp complex subunit ScpB [Candidatus Pacearchaeota archaeon]